MTDDLGDGLARLGLVEVSVYVVEELDLLYAELPGRRAKLHLANPTDNFQPGGLAAFAKAPSFASSGGHDVGLDALRA